MLNKAILLTTMSKVTLVYKATITVGTNGAYERGFSATTDYTSNMFGSASLFEGENILLYLCDYEVSSGNKICSALLTTKNGKLRVVNETTGVELELVHYKDYEFGYSYTSQSYGGIFDGIANDQSCIISIYA